jgi:hypothetical protein
MCRFSTILHGCGLSIVTRAPGKDGPSSRVTVAAKFQDVRLLVLLHLCDDIMILSVWQLGGHQIRRLAPDGEVVDVTTLSYFSVILRNTTYQIKSIELVKSC